MTDLSAKIHLVRKKLNLNQKIFAEKINVSFAAIRNYESGSREPRAEVLRKIAEVGNVSLDWLLADESKQQQAPEGYMLADNIIDNYDREFKKTLGIPQVQMLLSLISQIPEEKRSEALQQLLHNARFWLAETKGK